MLKFQTNYTTTIQNFEDFILVVFVLIDDLYHAYAPTSVTQRRNVKQAKLSDSEIITISICGELVGIDSEKAWFSFVKRNYSHFFPTLGSRSRFNRTRRALLSITELLREKLLGLCSISRNRYFIVDSFPLPVCTFGRAPYCHSFRGHGADYGYCASKKEIYFGYKVHALVTLEGFLTTFVLTPASTDDRKALQDMVDSYSGSVILGDKGYVSQSLQQELQKQNIDLIPLKRSNSKEEMEFSMRQLVFRFRRRIETVFSQLREQLHTQRVLAKSFSGLCTRLVNKILAHNLCMVLQLLFGNSFELGQIKQLIF